MTSISDIAKKHLLAISAIMAITLQIQITLFANETYAGLRISLADCLLPLIVLYAIISVKRKRTHLPKWENKHLPFILVLLFFIMSFSLINSYFFLGTISSWALINKYFGFIILLLYLMISAWLTSNICREKMLAVFLKYFVSFFILTLLTTEIAFCLQPFLPFSLWLGDFPWDGFMANRNSFVILFLLSALLLEFCRDNIPPFPNWYQKVLWFTFPAFCIYNASRTGWIFIIPILVIILIKSPRLFIQKILPFILLGIIFALATLQIQNIRYVQKNEQFLRLLALMSSDEKMYGGDKKRIIALEDGLELYQNSNPLIGAGLGSYKTYQIQKRGKFIDVIDFTALWLLVETGAIGLCAFSFFFSLCAAQAYKTSIRIKHISKLEINTARALFFFLISAALISCLHEILYTRFIWFFLGFILVQNQMNVGETSTQRESDVLFQE